MKARSCENISNLAEVFSLSHRFSFLSTSLDKLFPRMPQAASPLTVSILLEMDDGTDAVK